MASVELIEVGKTYPNGFEAVRAYSMDIAAGEFVVMVGPSGCGRAPVFAWSQDWRASQPVNSNRWSPSKRCPASRPKCGDGFQSYALYPHMTVFKTWLLGSSFKGTWKSRRASRWRNYSISLGYSITNPARCREAASTGRHGSSHRPPTRCLSFRRPLSNLDTRLRLQMKFNSPNCTATSGRRAYT